MQHLIYLLFILSASLLLTSCAQRGKQEPIHVTCDRLISQATASLKQQDKTLGKEIREKITNLIQAARIEQQHRKFSNCVDKAERANSLIGKPDAVNKN